MPVVKVVWDTRAALAWTGQIRRQMPFAAAQALNDTAKQAVRDYRSSLPKIFRAPTPFTLNSAFTRPASKANLEASVELRHFAAKGTPADRYLRPEIFGGPRGMKRSEKALASISGGAFVVPGRGAQLDAYGNMSRGQIVQILSALGVLGDTGQVGRRSRRRRTAGGLYVDRAGRPKVGGYFVARSKGGGRPLGIYAVTGPGRVEPVLIFVHQPTYGKRLPFYELIGRSASKSFGGFFLKRLSAALATAR